MKKIFFLLGFVVVLLILGEFIYQKQNFSIQKNGVNIVGSDKDVHGCIGTAGYQWCEEKKKCIRSWEEKCEILAGSDRDEHGCIGSAGYQWCTVKEKCLRLFEEDCSTPAEYKKSCTKNELFCPLSGVCSPASNIDCQGGSYRDIEAISTAYMEKFNVKQTDFELTPMFDDGTYASGSIYNKLLKRPEGAYYAMKVSNVWKIVSATRGSILCGDLTEFPSFPSPLISECADGKGNTVIR